MKSASFILLQGVPPHVSLEEVKQAIGGVNGVESVHELHIWQLSESKTVASVHFRTLQHDFMEVARRISNTLHDHGIHSWTIQPEYIRDAVHLQQESTVRRVIVPLAVGAT